MDWVVREWLGELQPASSWEAALAGCKAEDSRFYTLTFHDSGAMEDPTRCRDIYGLPGPAASYALEAIWKKTRDPRWHPMNRKWSHKSYWLSTIQAALNFQPAKYQLQQIGLPGQRLWPSASAKPKGRPRVKPMKKSRGQGRKDLLAFESRPHNAVSRDYILIVSA